MPKNTESLNRSLFDLLRSKGFDPTMLNTSGKEIPTPEEAEVFQFNFIKDGEDYGKVTISVDGLHKLCVYFSDEVANSEKEETHGEDESWYKILNQLKRFSQKYQLSFELRNVDHLKHDMAKREYMKKQERISEGYYPMGKQASYNDAVPNVKIILQHTRKIEEGEQRYRNIAKIFLENQEGERFLAPTIKPGIARVYGRLIAEGDKPHGDRWNHVTSLVEEYQKMGAFVRATRNGQFNESAQRLVNEGVNHYQGLRETLSRMTGHRGYNAYFESWTPSLMEDETEESNLNELFVQETLDPRIESVMPILNKLQKKVAEMKEVNELAEWADSLTEAPGAETLKHNDDTEEGNLKAFDLAEDDDLQEPAIDELEEGLGDIAKKVGGAVKKAGSAVLDKLGHGSDEELLKKLQKDAGVPQTAQHGKPNMGHPKDEERLEEDEFAGDFKTGPAGQWRNKGPKANKPAKVGDLVGASESIESDSNIVEGQEDLDTIKRLLGEGWKGELAGGTLGGVGGTVAGSALGALAGGPVGAAIGGVVGGAAGGTAGQMAGREMTKEEQLNEVGPLLVAGARAIMPLLSKIGPALGRMASSAGKAGAEVAGKTATGIGRGAADVAKSAAQSAAQNAGKVGVGVGAYQAITDVANSVVGGVGEVYHDAGKAAGAIAQAVGDAIDGKTIAELAGAAVKYSIPIGILLAVLYGGKKLIDQVMAEGADDSVAGLAGKIVGGAVPNPSDFVAGFKKTFEGQEDLDTIKRLLGK